MPATRTLPSSARPPAAARRRARGFTMTELLIAMGIVAILFAIGMPSYQNVTASNRLSAEINTLLYDLQYARAEAVKQGTPVTVCASFDGQNCLGWTWWAAGWIVFEDRNGNQIRDPGEAVLRVQGRLSGSDWLWPDTWLWAVTFNREGFALGMPGLSTMHMNTNPYIVNNTRCLQINLIGQMQTERYATGNCWW